MRRVVAATLECGHEYTFGPVAATASVHCAACSAARPETREERAERGNVDLLRTSLSFAVPLWVQRFIDEGHTLEFVLEQAKHAAQLVASQGDALMFKMKAEKDAPRDAEGHPVRSRSAGTAAVFNALAAGLAAASFMPGGVKAFGAHFESKPEWLKRKA